MAVLAAVPLPAPHLEHDDLLAQALADDLRADLGARHEGLADRDGLAAEHQDLGELDEVADGALELLDTKAITLVHPILLATRLDDRVHPSRPCSGSWFRCCDVFASGPQGVAVYGCAAPLQVKTIPRRESEILSRNYRRAIWMSSARILTGASAERRTIAAAKPGPSGPAYASFPTISMT